MKLHDDEPLFFLDGLILLGVALCVLGLGLYGLYQLARALAHALGVV